MTEDEMVGWDHRLQGHEFEQALGVGDALQPSHPLSSSSPPALNLSQHQGLSNEPIFHIRWPDIVVSAST